MKMQKSFLCLLLVFMMILPVCFSMTGCDSAQNDPSDTTEETGNNQPQVSAEPANSVTQFGAVGDGETDCTEAFKAASKSDKGSIYVPAGKYVIKSNLTISLPVRIDAGALIMIDNKITVTFEKYLDAGLYRIFGNDGNVVLQGNSVSYPEWFGGRNNGSTDSTRAIQRAIDCFPNGYGRVEFMQGKYLIIDSIVVTQSHMTLIGNSRQTRELFPMIISESASKPVLYLKGASGGNAYDGGLEDVTIENLEFSRTTMGREGSDTILLENTIYTTIQSCGFSMSQNGVRAVNVNGLRLYSVHATTGGDLPGKEVRGVFIDGSTRGSTGILIQDFIYYAYSSPNSITYGYKDVAKAGANGGSIGDRRINNFECDGSCDYGIYMSSAGDFACDISITDFTMDGIDTCGIYLEANNPYSWQQVNITNAYFRMDNKENKASALNVKNFAFVHATNCHVDNAVGKNNGFVFNNSFGSTVTACSFGGNGYNRPIAMDNCKQMVVTGNTSNVSGKLSFVNCNSIVVTSNVMPSCSLTNATCRDSIFENNLI